MNARMHRFVGGRRDADSRRPAAAQTPHDRRDVKVGDSIVGTGEQLPAVHDLRRHQRHHRSGRGRPDRAGHDAVQEGRHREADRRDRRRAHRSRTTSRCCRCRSSTTSCATGWRGRSTGTRRSGTTRRWPTRRSTSSWRTGRVTLTGRGQQQRRAGAGAIAGDRAGRALGRFASCGPTPRAQRSPSRATGRSADSGRLAPPSVRSRPCGRSAR